MVVNNPNSSYVTHCLRIEGKRFPVPLLLHRALKESQGTRFGHPGWQSIIDSYTMDNLEPMSCFSGLGEEASKTPRKHAWPEIEPPSPEIRAKRSGPWATMTPAKIIKIKIPLRILKDLDNFYNVWVNVDLIKKE